MHVKIQKWGNSQGLRFPKHILQQAQINLEDELNIFVDDGKIIIEPLRRIKNKYSLKELIAKMPADYNPEEMDWGKPVGKEEW